MNDDLRRLQQDIERGQQEIERSASLLKNTQSKVFSGSDGSYKSPNKRFSYGTKDLNIPPFSITSRSAGTGVTAGTINGIIPSNLFIFGTKNRNCTIIAHCTAHRGVVVNAKLEEGPLNGKPQEYEEGFPPEDIYITLVKIEKSDVSRVVVGSVNTFPQFVRGSLTYPPVYTYSWGYVG